MAHPDIELLNTVYSNVHAVDLPKSGGGLARFVDASEPLAYGSLTQQSSALTLSTSFQKIPFSVFSGENCEASSNGIKILQAGNYCISASAYATTGFSNGDSIHLAIMKNSSNMKESLFRTTTTNPYITLELSTIILSLLKNDVIYLHALNQTAARGTISTKSNIGLFLWQIN